MRALRILLTERRIMRLSSRDQMFVWVAALVVTLFLGIAEIVTAHQFRFAYLAATACVAVILAERVVRRYFKTRIGSQSKRQRNHTVDGLSPQPSISRFGGLSGTVGVI